jgi:hypothetical protein
VQDGPFPDTKEQLGGTFVIEVPDLDAAIEWAGRAPSVSWGHVQIRPTATRYVDGSWQGAPPVAIPDRRLELLFACAHPAINPGVRTPRMLQVVLGFEAASIAGVFAVQPTALAQRLAALLTFAQSRAPGRAGRPWPPIDE